MKLKLSFLFVAILLSSCEFDNKKVEKPEIEVAEPIPNFVDYKVEVINKKYGPCQTDSLSSQCIDFSVEYPIVTGMISDLAIENINENIQSTIFDYAFISDKPEDFESLIEEMSGEYEGILKDIPDYKASWSMEVNSDIIYQDSLFISVASTIYSYTGGAHPNSYQVYRSYNLTNGKALSLSDILIPEFENTLNEAGEIEFRMLKEIPPSQSLKDKGFYFENGKFTLNDNFAIINNSLIFYFNPYEIAPYANGPTELELKLTDYVNLISDKGVLHDFKN